MELGGIRGTKFRITNAGAGYTELQYEGAPSIVYQLPTASVGGVLTNNSGVLSWNGNSGANFGVQDNIPKSQLLVLFDDGGTTKYFSGGIPVVMPVPTAGSVQTPTIGVNNVQNNLVIAAHNFVLRNSLSTSGPQLKAIEIISGSTLVVGSGGVVVRIGATGFGAGANIVSTDSNGNLVAMPFASATYLANSAVVRGPTAATILNLGSISTTDISSTGVISASGGITVNGGALSVISGGINTNTLTVSGTFVTNGISPNTGSTFSFTNTDLLSIAAVSTTSYSGIKLRNSDDSSSITMQMALSTSAGGKKVTINADMVPSATDLYALGENLVRWRNGFFINLYTNNVNSNLVPSANNTYDLGSSTINWNRIHVAQVNAGNFATDILPNANATRSIGSASALFLNVLSRSISIYTSGNVLAGSITGTTVGIVMSNNVLPSAATFTLGTSTAAEQWSELNVRTIRLYLSTGGTSGVFSTSLSGITVSSNILPLNNGTPNLGVSTSQWSNIHSRGLTMYRSDGVLGGALTATTDGFNSSANIIPLTNGGSSLGVATFQWSNIHTRGLTIYDTNGANAGILTADIEGIRTSVDIIPLTQGTNSLGLAVARWSNVFSRLFNVISDTTGNITLLTMGYNVASLGTNAFSPNITFSGRSTTTVSAGNILFNASNSPATFDFDRGINVVGNIVATSATFARLTVISGTAANLLVDNTDSTGIVVIRNHAGTSGVQIRPGINSALAVDNTSVLYQLRDSAITHQFTGSMTIANTLSVTNNAIANSLQIRSGSVPFMYFVASTAVDPDIDDTSINLLDPTVSVSAGVRFWFGKNGRFKIFSDTAYKDAGSSWTIWSDSRLKNDISDYSVGLSTVMNLNPKYYRLNKGTERNTISDNKKHVGFIAQELIDIYPEFVSKNGDYYAVDSNDLIYMMLNAIKELKRELDKKQDKA